MKSLFALLAAAAVWIAGDSSTISIPIQNPSFEEPVTFTSTDTTHNPSCGRYEGGIVPGWTARGGAGVASWTCIPLPDGGSQVAYLAYGGFGTSISQDLGVQPRVGTYVLTFYASSWFYSYAASYTASIAMGPKAICQESGWPEGDFVTVTMVCPVPGSIAVDHDWGFAPGNLVISFANYAGVNGGWPLLLKLPQPWKQAALTFTPQT